MTWAIVVYPAWDRWLEPDPKIRTSVENWLITWISDGPPTTSEVVDRHIEAVDRDIQYFKVVHEPTRVTVTYIVDRSGENDYAALLELRSRQRPHQR